MAKRIIEDTRNKPLTGQELQNLSLAVKDVFFFSIFCYVVHPVRGKVKFNLYPYQKSVLYNFVKNRFNIILKFRQAGITELISMYCLWLTMYHPNKKVNIISIKDITAKKVLKKIKYMYKNLPWYLQVPIINGRAGEYGSASVIEFDNGSFIESIPTSTEAGRSESLSLLVIDEAAIVRWASQIWAAAFPTLSCLKGSSKLIVKQYSDTFLKNYKRPVTKVLRIKDLCPNKPSVVNLEHFDLYTLTHTGSWKKILWSQNKGKMETWTVVDDRGKKLGATPKHRLFTTRGWRTVEEIIRDDLNIIQVDTKLDKIKSPRKTKCPDKEILKPIEGFPDYFVSNLGKVYANYPRKGFCEVPSRYNKDGYLRVGLRIRGVKRNTGNHSNSQKSKTFQRNIHVLVAEAFIGPKPKGYQVDHIDCCRDHNYVTNLRYSKASDNVKRSFKYNINAILSGISNDKLPYLLRRGKILEMYKEGFSYTEIAKELYPDKKQAHKFIKRIIEERGSRVYISKLHLRKKTLRTIYDIHVEDDESYITANNFVNHNTGGAAIVNSTPYGIGGFYHSTWVDSLNHNNPFNPIRLYWKMHPERDDNWYNEMARALGPRRTAQEVDGDFLGSGNTVFDLADIKSIEDCLSDYPPIQVKLNGQYRRFNDPDFNKEYFIGADVATGRATDYSSFTCMDRDGEEQVVYKGRMAVDQYAKLLGDTGSLFNDAVIAPESNDVGLAVTSWLQAEGYPNLYYYQKMVKKKGESRPEMDKSPGWMTTTKNRSVIINGLETDVRKGNCIIKDPFFVQEAYTFIYDSMNRPVALGKHQANAAGDIDMESEVYADDDIMGKAITNHIRKGKQNIIVLPK